MRKYKVLKEFLCANALNTCWLNPEEIVEIHHNEAVIKELLKKGYIEEIPERPKTIWDLKEGDEYYAISFDGCVTHEHINEVTLDYHERVIGIGNAFLTNKEAEKEIARRKAKVILERDTKGFKPDWKSHQYDKWEVIYEYPHDGEMCNIVGGELFANTVNHCCPHHELWFRSRQDAEASIKAHPDEWKTYLGVEE